MKNKLHEFDVLRVLAIFSLFLHHGGIYNFAVLGFPLENLIPYLEYFLLGAFTFMAAYLLPPSFLESHRGKFIPFWKAKFFRIYIPYVIALILFILFLEVEVGRRDLAIHLMGVQMIFAPRVLEPVMTLWYVGMLLVYYLIFTITLKYAKGIIGLVFVTLIVYSLSYYLHLRWQLFEFRYFYYFFVFGVGILCNKLNCLNSLSSSKYFLLDKLIFLILAVYIFERIDYGSYGSVNVLYVISVNVFILAAVLFTFSLAKLYVRKIGRLHLIEYIAIASYFAYLFHRLIWKLLLSPFTFDSDLAWFFYILVIGSTVVIIVTNNLQVYYNRLIKPFK